MSSGAQSQRPYSSTQLSPKPIEVWGGIECTVNRVGEHYHDQVALTRHADHIVADLERFAQLGIRRLRYPVLWQRIAPHSVADAEWFQTDVALAKMRELGIKPIVGLVHHGSGPRHTSLVDPDFPAKLSEFATAVARRYPWVDMYTPINEPLTTARFATLYGLWYPHARDDRSFARAMVNQCTAIREAIAAIRSVNSQALLVQTEDLGRTYSTPAIAYQATFDNNRRWLTFDMLGGRVDEWHPLWWYLLESGVTRHELESFLTRPCVPDIIGINHYVTSDRFLDDRIGRYPEHRRGGNGRHAYADVEAVRTLDEGIAGHAAALRDAWNRYGLPLAITEVHLGCTREEQLRWLNEAWRAANELRLENVDVRAVTVWSLLGCYGWCSLLTSDFDCYEPGTFDLRSPRPRATAIATMAASLATKGEWDHPVLDSPGWWRRKTRFMYGAPDRPTASADASLATTARPILITGANGTLARAFQRVAKARGLAYRAVSRAQLDICQPAAVSRLLNEIRPWAVVNAAGYVRVDEAETDAVNCFSVNTEGARVLAEQCLRLGIQFTAFSSDLVFDGNKKAPYVESDRCFPLNIYGASKARLEEYLRALPNTLIIRTSAFFGPWDRYNFVATTLEQLTSGQRITVASDTIISPTYIPDLVNAALDLITDGERGIWHLANNGSLTWYDFARRVAECADLDEALISGKPIALLGLRARRPLQCALASERGQLMPDLENAIERCLDAVKSSQTQPTLVESGSSA